MAYALSRVRRSTADFFIWWFDQLRTLLPERLKRLLAPDVAELILELHGGRLLVRRRAGGTVRNLGIVDLGDAGAVKRALRPLLKDQQLDRMRVCLGLPADRALRRVVDLPAVAEENLRQVVAFEMDRLTPFPADAVHYDVHILDRDPESRRIRAELMVLPRAAVDPSVETLRRFDLEPDAVALPRHGRAEGGPPWRVPLAGNGTNGRRLVGRKASLLLLLAAALLVAGIWLAFERERNALAVLDREVAAARKDAEEGRALQEEIDRLTSEGNFIVDRKRGRPPIVEVLAELTRAMPDDTWLYRMRLLDQELQTFGYSPNASALIGIIENSPLFSNAQFRAPLTRDQRVEAEQFHIAFRVQRENQP